MAAAAPAQASLQERMQKMCEFFARLPESERQRWIALIEMQAAEKK
jgi:hypothetical protein